MQCTRTSCYLDNYYQQESTIEAICAATIGATLPGFTSALYDISKGHPDEIRLFVSNGYIIAGFIGAMISVISLVS